METFRGSQGKHSQCVLTRSLTLRMTSYARLGGYVKCSVRLRLGERPLRRLRLSVVPAARLVYVGHCCRAPASLSFGTRSMNLSQVLPPNLGAKWASSFPTTTHSLLPIPEPNLSALLSATDSKLQLWPPWQVLSADMKADFSLPFSLFPTTRNIKFCVLMKNLSQISNKGLFYPIF